ncbi:hypothetical protein PF006_g23662 [Phytophthora fragariae]|uniref:Uncharacterized protein n=1 Tax=Phytophthora fragariae TaxID=53985 RepID=A0A6A3RJM7_9STRA|nr:hypothetical protein PF006_g23662 [Phytophthora fragariae]KAE9295404.1 hypothetical protein PF008_g24272 [Phytophthora fragariae]
MHRVQQVSQPAPVVVVEHGIRYAQMLELFLLVFVGRAAPARARRQRTGSDAIIRGVTLLQREAQNHERQSEELGLEQNTLRRTRVGGHPSRVTRHSGQIRAESKEAIGREMRLQVPGLNLTTHCSAQFPILRHTDHGPARTTFSCYRSLPLWGIDHDKVQPFEELKHVTGLEETAVK